MTFHHTLRQQIFFWKKGSYAVAICYGQIFMMKVSELYKNCVVKLDPEMRGTFSLILQYFQSNYLVKMNFSDHYPPNPFVCIKVIFLIQCVYWHLFCAGNIILKKRTKFRKNMSLNDQRAYRCAKLSNEYLSSAHTTTINQLNETSKNNYCHDVNHGRIEIIHCKSFLVFYFFRIKINFSKTCNFFLR